MIVWVHPNAIPAADAAQCAFSQGRFWEYHDLLFEGQNNRIDGGYLSRPRIPDNGLHLDGTLLLGFTLALGYTVVMGIDLEDCGCFGSIVLQQSGATTFIRNLLLLALFAPILR